MRKATDDVLARTEAEREIGDELEALGFIDGSVREPTGVAQELLREFAVAVEFETGNSKDPDRNVVPMRRVVITGAWRVNPDAGR